MGECSCSGMCSDAAWTGVDVVGVLVAGVTGRGSWSSCCGRKEAFPLAPRHTPHVVTSLHQVFFPGVFLVFRVFLSGSPVPVKIWIVEFWKIFFHGFFCH